MKHHTDACPGTLSREESLRLVGNAGLGRIIYISRAMPAIRLVTHILQDENIMIGTRYEPEIADILGPRGTSMVVYQADMVDPATARGWNVVITGTAALVADPDEADRVRPQLRNWSGEEIDMVLRIRPELVTGFRATGRRPNSAGDRHPS